MGVVLMSVWVVGAIVGLFVLRRRAGLDLWSPLNVGGRHGVPVSFVIRASIKATFWPITLYLWHRAGKPDPTMVFRYLDD